MSRAFPSLFQPFQVRNLTLPNRIVQPAMAYGMSVGGVLGPEFAEYYRLRALGGTGLIFTDGTCVADVAAPGRFDTSVFHGIHSLASYKYILEQVHGAGGRMVVQLHHKGGTRVAEDAPNPYVPSISPSGVGHRPTPDDPMRVEVIGEPMTRARMDEVARLYGDAAATAKEMGFDGVEVHAGHGYLLYQFLWPVTNLRTDDYGGSPANRARFVAEVVAEVRRRVGPDFPVFFRFSQWCTTHYGAKVADTPQELEQLLKPISEAGVDVIDCSQRRFWEHEFEDSNLNLAGWAKKVTGKPTITVGSVTLAGEFTPQLAASSDGKLLHFLDKQVRSQQSGTRAENNLADVVERLDRGEFDLIAIGRSIIANWNWATLVREQRMEELAPYTSETLIEQTTFPHLANKPLSRFSESGA